MKNLILIALLVMIAATAKGTIIEISLDSAGQYNSQDTWSSSFDFGVSFSQINDIYIDWSGQIVGEDTSFGVVPAQFVATLYESDPQSYFGQASVYGGAATYPTPEPFNLQSSFTDEGWSSVYDGHGNIEIWFGDIIHVGITESLPTGQIDTAKLVIDGIIVPEPATLSLLAFGTLIYRRTLS